jgi:hypothetical protein
MSKESQKEFYHQQRLKAEKSGDAKTTAKIYDKLNKSKYGEAAETKAAMKSATPSADASDKEDRDAYLNHQNVSAAAEKSGRSILSRIFGG